MLYIYIYIVAEQTVTLMNETQHNTILMYIMYQRIMVNKKYIYVYIHSETFKGQEDYDKDGIFY